MNMTLELLEKALPSQLRGNANQELVDKINNIANDPIIAENMVENFMTYSNVLREGRYKTDDYINAVSYVTYKVMGYNNQDAYVRTFPQRYQALKAKGATDKDISAYVSAYNKGALVNAIMEKTIIPMWVLHQDKSHEAVKVLAELMHYSKSDKVRADAANNLLNHLKKPETAKVQMDITVGESDSIQDLKATMRELAQVQLDAIGNGITAKQVAHQPLVIDHDDTN